jgi:uncharacterized UPF0160 family protein
MLFYFHSKFKNCKIVRSTEAYAMREADLCLDIGREYNPES